MASSPVLQLRMSEETFAAIDERRGGLTRSAWVRNAVLTALARQRPPGAPHIPPGSLAAGDAVRLRHEGEWPADTATLRAGREPCKVHPPKRVHKQLCGLCGHNVGDDS